jgi:prepilin-type N-terminal cleavage/methylation domain-containing protein
MKFEKGLTLVELLLVISIVAIIGASTSPFLSNFVLQTNFDTTLDKVTSSVRKAQSNAMNKKNDSVWGVCLIGTNIRLYSGSCSSPQVKEDFDIPNSVDVSSLTDTIFNLRGEPSVVLNITVATSQESAVVNVNSAGGVNVN